MGNEIKNLKDDQPIYKRESSVRAKQAIIRESTRQEYQEISVKVNMWLTNSFSTQDIANLIHTFAVDKRLWNQFKKLVKSRKQQEGLVD